MATVTIFGATGDGDISSGPNATYATVRSGTGLTAATATANLRTGQNLFGGNYTIFEGFLAFDTTSLAGIGTLTATTLSLYGQQDFSIADFTIEARVNNWGATLTTADWVAGASLSGQTLLASFATAGFSTSGYNDFTESSGALTANLNTAGTTYFMLCSSKDTSGTAPAGTEYVHVYSADQAGTTNDPKIVVTYTTSQPHSHGAAVGASFPTAAGTSYGAGDM